jgi:hypothetical protein
MAKDKKLEAAARAAMWVVHHLEQLAGIGLDLRSPRHHDADVLRTRAVAEIEGLCQELVDLRQALSIRAVRRSLRHGYVDSVAWCDVEGREAWAMPT